MLLFSTYLFYISNCVFVCFIGATHATGNGECYIFDQSWLSTMAVTRILHTFKAKLAYEFLCVLSGF